MKIIPLQFQPVSLDQLTRSIGSLSPMSLLWLYMGYSPAYAAFAGFGETVGAFLLLFRKTTTAGALILIALLSNVAFINFAYDVPVKVFSGTLLLAVVVLALSDAKRLLLVFVRNQATQPADLSFPLGSKLTRIRKYGKPTIVVGACCLPLIFAFTARRSLTLQSPLYGEYSVEQYFANGIDIPALVSNAGRWRSIVFSGRETIAVRMMSDSLRNLAVVVDTLNRHISAPRHESSSSEMSFDYSMPMSDILHLRGLNGRDNVDIVLRRLDDQKSSRLMR
ncbi:MAG: hypothetical protein ABJB66_03020 [Gemmatimonadaceae bacterium]